MIRRLVAITLASVLAAAPALAQTVIIVRHAEKAGPTGDVDLSPAGQARAQALARALAGAHVKVVLTSPAKRTKQTAQPTAQAAGVSVTPIAFEPATPSHAQRVAAKARQQAAGVTVLIVGHSDTVGEIAHLLGDANPETLTECDFDKMTVIQLRPAPAPAKVIHTRYGVPTASC